ncbi:MAG: hypothetical protein Alpg2KO_29930 [Alphaproteobacteria bacterium]
MTANDNSQDRLNRIRRILGSTRAGKVQFIVNPEMRFVPGLQSEATSGGMFGSAKPARPIRGRFVSRGNVIELNPAFTDAELVQTLAQKCLEANVHRYKASFPLLGAVEKLPGMRSLWSKVINTLVDAAMAELAEDKAPGFESLPRLRDGTVTPIVQEIIDVVEHGIEGIVTRDARNDAEYKARYDAIMGQDATDDTPPPADRRGTTTAMI